MSKALPYVSQPNTPKSRLIGNDACGIIEMAEYGYLGVGEADFIASLMHDAPDVKRREAEICHHIAAAEEITKVEAYRLLQSAIEGKEMEPNLSAIMTRHVDLVQEMRKMLIDLGNRNMTATVTALMKFRCNREWEIADTLDPEFPRPIFEGVWKLAQSELATEQSGISQSESTEPTEEDLGKQSGKPKSRARTGGKSSGS